ncbi:MAG: peptidase and chymotrypsin/Hap [Rubritepida sp.]|nr:peptidase and chymotrypsin/Hap [Rubritepida sp.]
MSKTLFFLFCLLASFSEQATGQGLGFASTTSSRPQGLSAEFGGGIVFIRVTDGSNTLESGTGFIISSGDADGIKILTARHLFEDDANVVYRRFTIRFSVGTSNGPWFEEPASSMIPSQDRDVDAALVFPEVGPILRSARPLPICWSSSLEQGDAVYALGWPRYSRLDLASGRVRSFGPQLIFTDAPIEEGHSGGPVFDANRIVVGIVISTLENSDRINAILPMRKIQAFLSSKITPFSSCVTYRDVSFEKNANSPSNHADVVMEGRGRLRIMPFEFPFSPVNPALGRFFHMTLEMSDGYLARGGGDMAGFVRELSWGFCRPGDPFNVASARMPSPELTMDAQSSARIQLAGRVIFLGIIGGVNTSAAIDTSWICASAGGRLIPQSSQLTQTPFSQVEDRFTWWFHEILADERGYVRAFNPDKFEQRQGG